MARKRKHIPIFELQEDQVKVEIMNSGVTYISSEEFNISYEDFNEYLKEGIESLNGSRDPFHHLIREYSQLVGRGTVRLPMHTVRWSLEGRNLTLTELVGGLGFHTIDTITIEGQKNEVELDFGSIYEVTATVRLEEGANIELVGVNRYQGILYVESREGSDLKRVPYLENYMRSKIEEKPVGVKHYLKHGIGDYISDMQEYTHSDHFLEEVRRVKGTRSAIDWGVIVGN